LELKEAAMFDLDAFLAACTAARQEAEPLRAIKDVLDRAMSDPEAVAAALPPERAGLERLHSSPELTVLKLVWAPGMRLWPHDHRMWAAIGIYSGGEENEFFRRNGSSLVETGGRSLRPGDVCLLGDDVIHAVENPTREFAGAIHVYGGDFFAEPRSVWPAVPYEEEPFEVEQLLAQFEAANAAYVDPSA
jgi:predicted metal-dependent enzyme (double-stranded beta helix superfamily)